MNTFIKREYDYAIRICAYLAGRDDVTPVPLPLVAKILYITKPFATKIVHQLKKAGITGSAQGKMGGIFLKGEMGAAMAGATLYPAFAELALMANLVPSAGGGPEADLNELAADLEDVLQGIDLNDELIPGELYVP